MAKIKNVRTRIMENKSAGIKNIIKLALCEVVVSALVCGVFLIIEKCAPTIGKYDYTVLLGAILGSVVTVANFALLTVSVNRAVDRYLELRGDREMDDEEAEKFASEHAMAVQNAATRSFIIRTLSMLATLAAAFILTSWFSPIATAVPLLMFRPLLAVIESIKGKKSK